MGSRYNDRLAGNAGANRLHGRTGADVLVGRGGADRFVYYEHLRQHRRGAGPHPRLQPHAGRPDRPRRHRRQRAGRPATRRSSSSARAPFTAAGQLRFFQQNGDTVVEANTTDATAGAEMRIVLDPLLNLQATDFIFADISSAASG